MLPAVAQTYPNRTVSVVVPYPAGGSVDGVARIITQKLNESLGQHFIVDNRAGGAGGVVGANYVAKAEPDGATLLLTASIHVITPFLYKNIPYDVVKDFTPITLIATGPLLVSTSPKVPADNLKEFFDLVRKDPSKFTFATSSFGSAGHLAIELLKRDAGVDTLVIAYKGAGPALNDLMAGQVQLMVDPMLSSLPLAQGKAIKALAVTSAKRLASAPEIPTVAESGMTGFEFVSWYGLWAPKNLPPGAGGEAAGRGRQNRCPARGEATAGEHSASSRSARPRNISPNSSPMRWRRAAGSSPTPRSRPNDQAVAVKILALGAGVIGTTYT